MLCVFILKFHCIYPDNILEKVLEENLLRVEVSLGSRWETLGESVPLVMGLALVRICLDYGLSHERKWHRTHRQCLEQLIDG